MFGFVKPFVPELRVGEHEFYKSVYCGLCRAMKRETGALSCATLSYDVVFLALLRLSATGGPYSVTRRCCARHPFRRRPMMGDTAFLRHAAKIGAVLVSYHVKDDREDERGGRKALAAAAYPYTRRFCRRANMPEAERAVEERLHALNALEKEKCAEPDRMADEFGRLLAVLAGIDLPEKTAKILSEVAFHIGRWIYLADAVCDYPEDKKRKRYNPFLYAFEGTEMADFVRMRADDILTLELREAERALDLLDPLDERAMACVRNILHFGMKNEFSLVRRKEWKI